MPYGLSEDALNRLIKVFESNSKIDRILIFGSRALGRYKEGSDIDLAIVGKDFNFDDILSLHLQLDELMLGYSFDLIVYSEDLDPKLKDHIDRVGIELFKRWTTMFRL